ncbi:MAG: hypothetical protein IH795_02605, partial [Bacteroidetes bacterium]|nr:hypothetical protein [Bacteroidota bacterium]
MALKLYGCVDTATGIEFMVRSNTRGKAQATADALQTDLNVAGELSVDDFGDPVEILTTLASDQFSVNGPVNGGSLEVAQAVKEYKALRLDGMDNSFAFAVKTGANNPLQAQEVIAFIQFDDYMSGTQTIASKWNPGAEKRVWKLEVNSLGQVVYSVTELGTAGGVVEVIYDLGVPNGTAFWVSASFLLSGPTTSDIAIGISFQNQFIELENFKIPCKVSFLSRFFIHKLDNPGKLVSYKLKKMPINIYLDDDFKSFIEYIYTANYSSNNIFNYDCFLLKTIRSYIMIIFEFIDNHYDNI